MPRRHIFRLVMVLGTMGLGGLMLCIGGCESNTSPPPDSSLHRAPTTQPKSLSQTGGRTLGRAELWSQTCNRCHNAWSPDQLSAEQWDVVMRHMRFRASLTEEDHREILQFLQSAR